MIETWIVAFLLYVIGIVMIQNSLDDIEWEENEYAKKRGFGRFDMPTKHRYLSFIPFYWLFVMVWYIDVRHKVKPYKKIRSE